MLPIASYATFHLSLIGWADGVGSKPTASFEFFDTGLIRYSLSFARTLPVQYAKTVISKLFWYLYASLCVSHLALSTSTIATSIDTPLPAYIANSLGPYAPYAAYGEYTTAPSGCTLSLVNILQRHGARYPTTNAGARILASVNNLKAATSFAANLSFVPNYLYSLGVDDLNPLGVAESYMAGQQAWHRYGDALGPTTLPFSRADSSQRVVDSASNWTTGFQSAAGRDLGDRQTLIINGTAGSNTTLENHNCPLAPTLNEHANAWLESFAASAVDRFKLGAPGAAIAGSDILNFMMLCGFETEYNVILSPFCALFTQSEWQAFEYYYDLEKTYGNGYGNPLGAIQGVGYVNELLSRLHNSLAFVINDQTTVNHTLDTNPTTFPLGERMYIDFSHDNQITSILAAMGLKKGPALTKTGPPAGQVWVTSQIVPFSGRVVTELLTCSGAPYVRIFINDQIQKLVDSDANGLVSLESFSRSQAYSAANGQGQFSQCGYSRHTASTGGTSV